MTFFVSLFRDFFQLSSVMWCGLLCYDQLVAFFLDTTPEITSMTFVLVNRLIDMLSCDRLQVVELHLSHPIETAGKTLPQLCCHATKRFIHMLHGDNIRNFAIM